MTTDESTVISETAKAANSVAEKDSEQEQSKALKRALYNLNNKNNATALIPNLAEKLNKKLKVYEGVAYAKINGVYIADPDAVENVFIESYRNLTEQQMKAILHRIRIINYPHTKFPLDTKHINFKNCRLCIDTKETIDYKDDDIIFSKYAVNYNKNIGDKCDVVDNFISTLADGQETEIRMLWEMIGYSLAPGNALQGSYLMLGEAGVGKSVLLKVIAEITGYENTTSIDFEQMNNPSFISSLVGKQLCLIDEITSSNVKDNSGFKMLTSEAPMTAKYLYQEPFTFQYHGKILMSANDLPKIFDSGNAVNRRVVIVPCRERPLDVDKITLNLENILLENSEYIVKKGIDAYFKILETNKFYRSPRSLEKSKRAIEISNPFVEFASQCLTVSKLEGAIKDDIYSEFREWCDNNGHQFSKNQGSGKFFVEVKKIFDYEDTRTGGRGKRKMINVKRKIGNDPEDELQTELPF